MKIDEIKIVQQNWELIRDSQEELNRKFYQYLFASSKEIKQLYPESVSELKLTVVDIVDIGVQNLQNLDRVAGTLENLGKSYARSGAIPVHYPVVVECFLAAMKSVLNEEFTVQLCKLWSKALNMISARMVDGGKTVNQR